MPDLAVSASSWNVPLLSPYVARRTCCMIVLLCLGLARCPGPPAANSSQGENEASLGYQAFAENQRVGRYLLEAMSPWILDSPVTNGGSRLHPVYTPRPFLSYLMKKAVPPVGGISSLDLGQLADPGWQHPPSVALTRAFLPSAL